MRETGAKLPEGFVYIGEDMSSVFFGNSKIRTTDLMWVFGRNEFFYQHKKPENKSPHLVIRRGNMKLLLHSLDDRIELYDLRKSLRTTEFGGKISSFGQGAERASYPLVE